MKHLLGKWLAALLIAALLLTPVAMMEEAPAGEPVVTEIETTTEEAPEDVPDDVPEDVPEDVPVETSDAPEAAVIPEAVDAVVTEVCDIALDGVAEDAEPVEASDEAEEGDAPAFEAEIVEESLDDIAEYEAAEEASEPEGAAAIAEEIAEESTKLRGVGAMPSSPALFLNGFVHLYVNATAPGDFFYFQRPVCKRNARGVRQRLCHARPPEGVQIVIAMRWGKFCVGKVMKEIRWD